MANKNYTYPRISIKTEAMKRSSVRPAAEDTTVLFAPITTEKGPHREIVRVHDRSEFYEIFGELSYERNGQMALNIYNWLDNGGTVYVYRLAGFDGQEKAKITSLSVDYTPYYNIVESKFDVIKDEKDVLSNLDNLDADADVVYYLNTKDKVLHKIEAKKSAVISEAITTYAFSTNKNASEKNIYFITPDVYEIVESGTTTYSYAPSGKASAVSTLVGREGLFTLNKGASAENAVLIMFEKKGDIKIEANLGSAKYYGEFYDDIKVKAEIVSKNDVSTIFDMKLTKVINGKVSVLEAFYRVNSKKYKSVILGSEYIGADFDANGEFAAWLEESEVADTIEFTFNGANDDGITEDISALTKFYASDDIENKLANVIETPIDIMLDAGYPIAIKKKMVEMVSCSSQNAVRPDIVCILDRYELTNINGKRGYLNIPSASGIETVSDIEGINATNIAIYDQYFTINDAIFTDQNIYVTPSYFLSKLIAYNDMTYGIQFPTAGIRRGVLDDALAINENPNADLKEQLFKDRINYVEKTPREYAFMNQRTHDGSSVEEYTALSFLNNVRVVEKMKKELERLGRNYLFEFNDAITLTQLSDVLNKYVMNWIANRTLATGVVTVERNPYSDEAVDVTLTIRFNGTIEVISVQITIE